MAGLDRHRDRRPGRERRAARFAASVGVALALIHGPAAIGGDREARALFREADALAASGDVSGAALRLEAALDSPGLSPLIEAVVRVRLAELRRFHLKFRAALDQLDAAGALLGSGIDDRRYLAHILVIRAQIFLDWGLLDQAAFLLLEQRDIVSGLREEGHDVTVERLAALHVGANLELAREDYRSLARLVESALEDEVTFTAYPGERAKLRARLALGLHEEARTAPHLRPDARLALQELLADALLPASERTRPRLALAEIAIREGALDEAMTLFAEVPIASDDEARHQDLHATLVARLALERQDPAADLDAARTTLEDAFDRFLSRWSERDPRPGGYGVLQYADAAAMISELIRFALRTPGESGVVDALEILHRAQALGSLTRGTGAVDVATIRTELLRGDRERGVLIYLPAAERSHLFALDLERLRHFELDAGDVFSKLQRRLSERLGRPPTDAGRDSEFEPLRAELAERLLPDRVRAHISGWSGVTMVGLDLLDGISFEALPFGEQPFLGAALAVDSVPSLPFAVDLARRARERHVPPRPTAWLFTSPDVPERDPPDGDAIAPLSVPDDEATAIVSAWGPTAHVWSGAEATLDRVFSPELAEVALVQFLTHGVLDLSQERPSSLCLTPAGGSGGLLGAPEVERRLARFDAGPPLVILTACRSAAAPTRRGDPASADLVGAFLGGGSATVIASTHDLERNAALRLSVSLHRALAGGATPAEALRRARVELMEDERFRDPFYHAHLRVIGLGHVPLVLASTRTGPGPRVAVGSLIALLLALAGAAWARRRRGRAA